MTGTDITIPYILRCRGSYQNFISYILCLQLELCFGH